MIHVRLTLKACLFGFFFPTVFFSHNNLALACFFSQFQPNVLAASKSNNVGAQRTAAATMFLGKLRQHIA